MSQRTRAVNPALLPHDRPCWCDECRRAYQQSYRSAAIEARVCDGCGAEYVGGPTKRFCSRQCWPPRAKARRLCKGCPADITGTHPKRRWCSETCRVQSYKQPPPEPVMLNCQWCYQEFPPGRKSKRSYCSLYCGSAANAHIRTWRTPDRCYLGVCIDCRMLHGRPPYLARCCYECQAIRDARRRDYAQGRRSDRYRRGEKIHWMDLLARDGPTCHLCSESVDPDLRSPHPRSGTVDHLVPIALGGSHSLDNVRLAHRSCNISRGTKPHMAG